jgi:hypothetical protein
MKSFNANFLLLPTLVIIPSLLASCSVPEVSSITCENTSIISQYKDGSQSRTPQSALGKEEFTWLKEENKIEVKAMGAFDKDGNYKETIQKVPALLKKDILTFKVKSSGIFPAKSYKINLSSKTYSSSDLDWQSSTDGSFKIFTKGTCLI